ncbi:hypothetical protein [Luteibacter aegosomatissinici]|uniref:hypothetical protein n=1 Tax=Luteibacter aegosomatissinici TaxID=2911539 RepID=UPI001FF8A087|nr:hypothetical protein [Luteibacter aegosomatissinici]UPG94100.1 hypothetical protein L2Y97_20105 [Luteibacter aegosomatissinici]
MAKRDPASSSKEIVPTEGIERGESPVAKAILEFVSRIPESEVPKAARGSAEEECRRLASAAANKAALTAGSLALPPGPLGWLTVLPELVAIWRIQGQLVSDIAAAYGKTAKLGREQMLWCLFRHTAAQAFRDIAIRVGDRLVFRTTATSVLQRLAGRIGVSVTKRAVGKGISRWLPVVGALGVGAYAYYDTGQVAKTAIELFSGDIHIDDGGDDGDKPARKTARTTTSDDGAAPTRNATKAPKAANGPAGARLAHAPAPKAAARKAVKKTASRKRATVKKTSAPKTAAAKSATKKATKKTTARRPATKKTTRKSPSTT